MVQEYVNIEKTPIETIFLFPNDVRTVINKITSEFKLTNGSTYYLETKVLEKEKAETQFNDAIASGKTAVISSYSSAHRDLVRISIGNFPPKSSATLTIYYD